MILRLLVLLLCATTVSGQSLSNVIKLDASKVVANVKERHLTVEVSDSTKAIVEPTFKVSAWGSECSFKVDMRPNDVTTGNLSRSTGTSLSKDSVKFSGTVYEMDVFAVESGLEWTITLNSDPKREVFTFPIESKGLNFYYQDTLSDEEKDLGCIRPDSVIGSYAVYHSTKRDNWTRGSVTHKYMVGKAFHIFRPKAWDNNGDTVWCGMNIESNILTITTPKNWLKNAAYPVVIDPKLGEEGVGGSVFDINGDWLACRLVAPEASVSLDSITGNWNLGLYGGSGNIMYFQVTDLPTAGSNWPDTVVGVTNQLGVGQNEDGWHDLALQSYRNFAAADSFHIGAHAVAGGIKGIMYDGWGGSSVNMVTNDGAYDSDTPPAVNDKITKNWNDATRVVSLYLTYTAEATESTRRRRLILGGN